MLHSIQYCIPALMCDKLTVVSGTEGQMFDFICEYPSDSKNNTKHFCCLDIDESFGQVISLSVDKQRGLFEVNIFTVTQEDLGKYRCGLEENGIITCLQELWFIQVLISSRQDISAVSVGEVEDDPVLM
uniref:Immunoglobulin V-set domain-containing protein n=1 Tax=Poecilia reticulata TaxID=8081 RepID=A0A3P9MSV6_POERE